MTTNLDIIHEAVYQRALLLLILRPYLTKLSKGDSGPLLLAPAALECAIALHQRPQVLEITGTLH